MKKIIFLFLGIILSHFLMSQLNNTNTTFEPNSFCAQTEMLEYMRENDPVRYQEFIAMYEGKETNKKIGNHPKGTIYTIPVVFHIIHNNGSENISDAQIEDALYILNRDIRKQNPDVNNVVSQFLPIAGDAEIHFEFATVAPDGTCFEGITRTVSSETSNGTENGGMAQVNAIIAGNDVYQGAWPHNRYLNVVVAKNLVQGAAGYTYLPSGNSQTNPSNMYYNSVFLLHNYTGSIGTSSNVTSRTLTHEVGHWLNLSHIWGNGPIGVCGNDFVSDTPTTEGSNGVCNLNKVSCDNTLDNVENYMDYSYCSKMFTEGQVSRMRTALTSNVAGRSNLWTTENLQLTGVLPENSLCSANIVADPVGLCAGSTTTFSVEGLEDDITSYSWSFPGGTPSTSTAANPTITYENGGSFNVSVTINTSSGPVEISRDNFITVIESPSTASLPLEEGFVDTSFPPSGWTVDNGGNATTWSRATVGTAPTNGNSAKLNFDPGFVNTSGDIDDLNTPPFSLMNMASSSLTFDVAYRPYSSVYYDKLEVLISPGCGFPFEVIYSKEGTVLQTEPASNQTYSNPNTWRNESIDLSPYIGNDKVQLKFRGISGYGSAVYIDNISIDGVSASTDPPTPGMSASSEQICAGETITFTDESTDNPTSWNWTFPGGNPSSSTEQNPVVSYPSSGTYNVTLEVSNNFGTQSETFTNIVTVNANPNVNISASSPTTCEGEAITLTATGASSYVWDNNLGEGITKIVNPSTSTTYQVTGTSNGCSNTAEISIDVIPLPVVSVSASYTTVCEGATVTLTASGAETYLWGGNLGSNSTIQVSPTSTTTYSVIGNNGECSSSQSITISVVDELPISVEASNSAICEGENVTITASGADSYLWSNNLTTNPLVISLSETTTYTVVGTSENCSGEGQITIQVLPTPDVELTVSPSNKLCEGEEITLTASGGNSYSWNNGISGSGSVQTVTLTNPGISTYTVEGFVGDCSNSSSIDITVLEAPIVVVNQNGSTLSVDLEQGETAEWYFEGTLIGEGETIVADATGVYTVVVTNGNDCLTSVDTTVDISGVSEEMAQKLTIYPNPATNSITIASSSEITSIVMTDNIGRVVVELQVEQLKEINLDISHFSGGVYQVQVDLGSTKQIKKLIVE